MWESEAMLFESVAMTKEIRAHESMAEVMVAGRPRHTAMCRDASELRST